MAVIYLADDDPSVLKLVKMTLELEGHEVLSFADGQAAYDGVRAGVDQVEICVFDVMMPFIDGMELTRRLRMVPGLAEVPIVLLSAKAQQADIDNGIAAGADVYMTKPFEPLDLINVVEELLAETV